MVTLPKGPHPRGERPYVFIGGYYGDHVPGAIVKGDRVICAEDAAWIFQQAGLRCVKGTNSHPVPQSFAFDVSALYPYQLEGVQRLAQADYFLLADEMGLGKTAQALCAAKLRLHSAKGDGPAVLILCPAIAKHHWAREVSRWTGYGSVVLDGVRPEPIPPTARFVIANYDILSGIRRKDAAGKLEQREGLEGWAKALAAYRFPIVICDEAHNLRGQGSQRTKAVKAVAEHSTCVWMLTGTPMPNRTRDIWSLWDIASDGLCGWFWPFAKAYCGYVKNQYGSTADGATREQELGARLSFWCLGRTKAGVGLQLPEKRREVVTVDVGEVPVDRFPVAAEPPIDHRTNVVASALRATARAKRPAVVEMAREALQAGQKVVVFTYLREQAEAVAKDLFHGQPTRVYVVTGAQSAEQRDVAAQQFREETGRAAFVATIDSVGVAISLVGADLVIFADLSYEPAKLLQAEGRCHRIGSTNRVLIRYVIAAGTLDEAVAETVVNKLDTITSVTGGMGDGAELTGHLRRGEVVTTEAIIERLFQTLIGGK